MFVSHHTLKWTRTCRSHGRHPHAHTAHFLLNRHSEWIDAQDEATRRDSLRALLHADGESGWRAAVAGMLEILESTGGADRAGVCLAAARHASGLGPVAYDDPVDLSEYDIAYTKEDE